jgi:hypothetical protein
MNGGDAVDDCHLHFLGQCCYARMGQEGLFGNDTPASFSNFIIITLPLYRQIFPFCMIMTPSPPHNATMGHNATIPKAPTVISVVFFALTAIADVLDGSRDG